MKSAEKEKCCLFCKTKFEEKQAVVYPKCLENICRIAKNHDFELQEIWKRSRKQFTDKPKNVDSQPTNSKRLRTKFMWKTLCFFCEKTINKDYKLPKEFSRAMTLEVKERVLKWASTWQQSPPNLRGDLKISDQNNWGQPEQKLNLGGGGAGPKF